MHVQMAYGMHGQVALQNTLRRPCWAAASDPIWAPLNVALIPSLCALCCGLEDIYAQVCGLKWSPDDREIASGGNDNQLYIWGLHSTSPVLKFSSHTAAVKAIAWSPHQHGLLASGGGTADRCIRFWNTATSSSLNSVDTGVLPRLSLYHSSILSSDRLLAREACHWFSML